MVHKKYFVNDGGESLGPYDMDTIVQMVTKDELKATDHIYLDDKDEWVLICQHVEFLKRFQPSKPPKPVANPAAQEAKPVAPMQMVTMPTTVSTPATGNTAQEMMAYGDQPNVIPLIQKPKSVERVAPMDLIDGTHAEWYVLKGKNRYGPFLFLDVLRMLQEKAIFEFDYVWRSGLESWRRIAEVADFAPDRIRMLIDQGQKDLTEIFYRRRHSRSKYECPIIIHDNNKVWKGRSLELSEGGAGVVIENAMILPGQNVYVHFKPGPQSKSFNVLCEIVSKKYAKGIRDPQAPIIYGVKFINIHKQDRDSIKTMTAA